MPGARPPHERVRAAPSGRWPTRPLRAAWTDPLTLQQSGDRRSTHRLAQRRVLGAVDAAGEDGEGQGRVEAEVQQRVPATAADADGAVGDADVTSEPAPQHRVGPGLKAAGTGRAGPEKPKDPAREWRMGRAEPAWRAAGGWCELALDPCVGARGFLSNLRQPG